MGRSWARGIKGHRLLSTKQGLAFLVWKGGRLSLAHWIGGRGAREGAQNFGKAKDGWPRELALT